MEVVGIKDLKAHLSHYIRSVKAGDEVLVTDRGRTVARIIPASAEIPEEVAALYDMARRGLVHLPQGQTQESLPQVVGLRGVPMADTVLEDRR